MEIDLSGVATIWELIEQRAALSPSRPMVSDEAGRRMNYGEFRDRAERVAAALYAEGVREATPVAWQLPSRIETLVLQAALCRLGAVQVPIIPLYREREVAFVLAETSAEVFFVPGQWRGFDYQDMARRIAAAGGPAPRVELAYDSLPEADPVGLPPAPTGAGDPIRWIYSTSGTTSDPKGVLHTDATLIAGANGLVKAMGLGPEDVGSVAFPLAHIAGPDYVISLLAVGLRAVMVETFVPDAAIKLFASEGVTMVGGTTAFYLAYLKAQQADPTTPIMPTLRRMSGGGAPKPPEIFFNVKAQLGVPILHGYGMTECPMITSGRPDDADEQLAYTDGKPVEGCQIRVDVTGAGPDGEIWVRGPMLCKGYTRPELTAEAFDAEGFFRTGDLGHLSAEGALVLTGRSKDIIIRKGENIAAKDIEDVLQQHPKIHAAAVIGLPDPERGERVCAVIEATDPSDPPTLAELAAFCRAQGLMTQKIPEQLEIRAELPRNPTLKVLKYKLREELGSASVSP